MKTNKDGEPIPGKHRGFAFVHYYSESDAAKAVKSETFLGVFMINVSYARPRKTETKDTGISFGGKPSFKSAA